MVFDYIVDDTGILNLIFPNHHIYIDKMPAYPNTPCIFIGNGSSSMAEHSFNQLSLKPLSEIKYLCEFLLSLKKIYKRDIDFLLKLSKEEALTLIKIRLLYDKVIHDKDESIIKYIELFKALYISNYDKLYRIVKRDNIKPNSLSVAIISKMMLKAKYLEKQVGLNAKYFTILKDKQRYLSDFTYALETYIREENKSELGFWKFIKNCSRDRRLKDGK